MGATRAQRLLTTATGADADPRGLRLGVIEPKDAIRAFEARKLLLPSFRWQDVWQEEHQRGFAVAGVMRADVLQIFQDALAAKFANGGTLADFRKEIKPLLAKKGFWGDVEVEHPETGETRITRFDDARLGLIYDVNVRQSYAAGKWQRYQQTKEQLPFVLYKTMEDDLVRPAHRAWDNLVLPIDDPFWKTHWPPNGWRCRCHAIQLNQRGVDRLEAAGQKLNRKPPAEAWTPYVNPYTQETKLVPKGVDPGFGYNPGVDNGNRDEALAETALQKAARADAYAGAVVAGQAATDMPALQSRRADAFARWVDGVRAAGNRTGSAFTVGTIRPEIVRALEAAGTPLDSSVLAVRDEDVDHTLRAGKSRGEAREALPLELYKRLPMLLGRPSAALKVANDDDAVVLVVDIAAADGNLVKLFVRVNYTSKVMVDGQRVRKTFNLIRTASLQAPDALHDANRYTLIWGKWP